MAALWGFLHVQSTYRLRLVVTLSGCLTICRCNGLLHEPKKMANKKKRRKKKLKKALTKLLKFLLAAISGSIIQAIVDKMIN